MFGNGVYIMDPDGAVRMARQAARRLNGGELCFIRIPPTALNPALEVSHA